MNLHSNTNTARAWQVLLDMGGESHPVPIKAWRRACAFLNGQRFWDMRLRLLYRGLIQLRGEGLDHVRITPENQRPAPRCRKAAPRRVQPAPGSCPVCARDTARWRRHAALGHICAACSTAAHMLRDAGTAQRLADMLRVMS